ncbi:MAG: hypothetical protein ACU0AY_01090 [Marinibacterium profundimaris]
MDMALPAAVAVVDMVLSAETLVLADHQPLSTEQAPAVSNGKAAMPEVSYCRIPRHLAFYNSI